MADDPMHEKMVALKREADKRGIKLEMRSTKPSQVEWLLRHKELFGFLQDVSRSGKGPACSVCGSTNWGSTAAGTGVTKDGTAEPYYLPVGYEKIPPGLSEDEHHAANERNGAKQFEFMCLTCGHVLAFNAGRVMNRVMTYRVWGYV